MSKLILSMDGLVLKEVSLTEERTTIGRRPSNHIVIDNLAISGEHAAIVTILNDSFLEDLGSTNGTVVNGQTIKKHFLQNNDLIELGKYKLKYLVDAHRNADFEKTMVLRPGQAPQPMSAAGAGGAGSAQPAPEASMAMPVPPLSPAAAFPAAARSIAPSIAEEPGVASNATIQILNGPNLGRELALTKPLTTLGRPGVQVAVITRRPQGYFITHVEGAVNPSINGSPIGAEAHLLSNHDVIELAGTKMEFYFK